MRCSQNFREQGCSDGDRRGGRNSPSPRRKKEERENRVRNVYILFLVLRDNRRYGVKSIQGTQITPKRKDFPFSEIVNELFKKGYRLGVVLYIVHNYSCIFVLFNVILIVSPKSYKS